MARPLSNDLRERVISAFGAGESSRAVASRFGVAPAATSGASPLNMADTNRSRPNGVKRAFLWMFIRSLLGLKLRNLSFLGPDRMDNLLRAHI